MRTHVFFAAFAISAFLLQSCISPQADMQRIGDTIQGSREYESTMKKFLIRGRYGDLDGMLALTSKITIRLAGGEGNVRELFKSDTMPALMRYRNLAPDGIATPGRDEFGHPAWSFKERLVADDGKELKMELTVVREDNKTAGEIGQLVIAYFGPWK